MNQNVTINLKPLNISCSQSDCENGLHCFRASKKKAKYPKGACQSCGADLIEWDSVHLKDLNNIDITFSFLKKEWIRHHFWHKEFSVKALNYARKKGFRGLSLHTRKRLRQSIFGAHPFRDGTQTPFESNDPVHYAQHATACCCRKCVEYWHGIPQNRDLTDTELEYLSCLVDKFLHERIPSITEEGVTIKKNKPQNE